MLTDEGVCSDIRNTNSIIVLTEYTNIIALTLFMITIFSLPLEILLLVLYTTSLTRPTFPSIV